MFQDTITNYPLMSFGTEFGDSIEDLLSFENSGEEVFPLDLEQFGKKESIADTAKVLSRYYDGIEFRWFAQKDVEELAKYASIPVWNGLTNESHPTQMIADMMTIKENFGHLKGLKLVYCGDARFNMANSLMVTCAKLGMHFVGCAPKKFWADKNLIKKCQEICAVTGGKVEFSENKMEATKKANIIYTDVWVSMGEPESAWNERLQVMCPFQVDMKTMKNAEKDNPEGVIFMHCLPAYHGLDTEVGKWVEVEVTDEVVVSKYSKCFDEAENRMHSIKAIMLATIGA